MHSEGPLSTNRGFSYWPIMLLAGEKGSGKSTVAKILEEEHGFEVCRLGDYVRFSLSERGLAPTMANELQRMRELKENSERTVLAHLEAVIYACLDRRGKLAVDAVFDLYDLDFFRRRHLNWRLVFLMCNPQTRLQRIENRKRPSDADVEMRLQLEHDRHDFSSLADCTFNNDEGVESLRNQIAGLVSDWYGAS